MGIIGIHELFAVKQQQKLKNPQNKSMGFTVITPNYLRN